MRFSIMRRIFSSIQIGNAEIRRAGDGGQRTEGGQTRHHRDFLVSFATCAPCVSALCAGYSVLFRSEMLKSEGRGTEDRGQKGAKRVIIVTSWYHSRRALHAFQHYAPDIQFYSRPAYFGYPRTQWSRAGISGYIRAEYVKLAGYWVCYGVCPL